MWDKRALLLLWQHAVNGGTLLQGFGIFITVHTGLVFWCPTMSLTLRKCEEMHSRRCVTNNQAAESRFKGAALMFWALRVVFTGDACLTGSTSKWCHQVVHAHRIILSGVRTKNQRYGNINAFILWITSPIWLTFWKHILNKYSGLKLCIVSYWYLSIFYISSLVICTVLIWRFSIFVWHLLSLFFSEFRKFASYSL